MSRGFTVGKVLFAAPFPILPHHQLAFSTANPAQWDQGSQRGTEAWGQSGCWAEMAMTAGGLGACQTHMADRVFNIFVFLEDRTLGLETILGI